MRTSIGIFLIMLAVYEIQVSSGSEDHGQVVWPNTVAGSQQKVSGLNAHIEHYEKNIFDR